MKLLIVNAYDTKGGAARAAFRLHKALLAEKVDSQMLVQLKASDDFTVIGPSNFKQKLFAVIRPVLDALPVLRYKQRSQTYFSAGWVPFSGIVDRINAINPDVVHLHWINKGMLNIADIAKIKAPVVWSLHDMWAFTGGCHHDEECGRYEKNCGKCKVLGSVKNNDLSRKIFNKKKLSFSRHKNLTVVCVSQWLAACATKSSLFKSNKVACLPNPIDSSAFSPLNKNIARDILRLRDTKKIVLFGAMNATIDPGKGYHLLKEALNKLTDDNIELVVFGSSEPKASQGFKFKVHYLGHLHDDISLRALYSAADVMVVPSLREAFGQTASEAMACGTPVVAFRTTGLLDIVDHKLNGYLAEAYSVIDLANGINWLLNAENHDEISANARAKVEREFDSDVVAKRYIDLYQSVVQKTKGSLNV